MRCHACLSTFLSIFILQRSKSRCASKSNIYDLHKQNKVGCIVNENNSLTLDSVYYHSNLILENIDKDQKVSLFIKPNPTLDTVLSLYLITYMINQKVQPLNDIYHMLIHILEEDVNDSHLNIHSLFFASIKLNNSEVTIKKIIAVIALIHSKIEEDPTAAMPELIKNIKIDQFTFLENEIKFIKRDYQTYENELKNSSTSNRGYFRGFTGKWRIIKGKRSNEL